MATNSLLGFIALLTRAYAHAFACETDWQDTINTLGPLLSESATAPLDWEATAAPLWTRSTTLVLYGPTTRIGAIDLESKFTETAIGHVQFADYRNFAHGRHHWLAKRSETTGVLAFITDADRILAERTLALVPTDVPQARLALAGSPATTLMASLLAALRITGWAGVARGIDPGRPGVPEFGRKLYRLSPPRRSSTSSFPRLTARELAAISRKANAPAMHLRARGNLSRWRKALATFLARLYEAQFGGIVLDYDGTVVDTRYRSEPPKKQMAEELSRLAGTAHVAFATGRGASVRRDLQDCLPRHLWPNILVGYYNGAQIAWLDDDGAPDGSSSPCIALVPVSEALRRQPELAESACQEDRRYQITLEAVHVMPDGRLWELAREATEMAGVADVTITCSSHSVDIVAPGVSKLNTVRRLREAVGDALILAIGDRGRWPGNDHELLCEPFALGVDELNTDPRTCWHLGKPGQRGPAVTLDYLRSLNAIDGRMNFGRGSLG